MGSGFLPRALFLKGPCPSLPFYKNDLDDFHPIALLSEQWIRQKIDYVHYNPVRKGNGELPDHWKYSSARNWILGDNSIIEIDREIL
jgi:hypothetical protein